MLTQLQYCEENQIPYAVIFGDSELEKGVVKLRDVVTRVEEEVPLPSLVDTVQEKLKHFYEQQEH